MLQPIQAQQVLPLCLMVFSVGAQCMHMVRFGLSQMLQQIHMLSELLFLAQVQAAHGAVMFH